MPDSEQGAAEDDVIFDDDASAPSARPLATDDLDAVLARRASPRRRILQIGVIIVPILVVASMILHVTLPPLFAVGTSAAVPITTPPPTAIPIPITVTAVSNISFGTLILNGNRLGAPPQVVKLRTGKNVITLTAPPFPRQSCIVEWTLNALSGQPRVESSCQTATQGDGSSGTIHVYIFMPLSGDVLPPDQLASARALVAKSFGVQTTTVPAGDYYATGSYSQSLPIARQAIAPLTATFAQTLFDPADTASASATNSISYACGSALCPGSYDPTQPLPSGVWLVDVQTTLRWTFTTSTGLIAGSLVMPAPGPHSLALTYSAATGWQIANAATGWQVADTTIMGPSPIQTSDLCQAGANVLLQAVGPQGNYGIARSASEPDGMRGCTFQAVDQGNAVAGTFLWRFGVLLAVDAKAHALVPTMPVAPPQEIAAATA